eukprot:Hpha_TRINITY_DN16190_c1_g3::TRINITY_DN16190_c1_g3_i7::g.5125::m.5125
MSQTWEGERLQRQASYYGWTRGSPMGAVRSAREGKGNQKKVKKHREGGGQHCQRVAGGAFCVCFTVPVFFFCLCTLPGFGRRAGVSRRNCSVGERKTLPEDFASSVLTRVHSLASRMAPQGFPPDRTARERSCLHVSPSSSFRFPFLNLQSSAAPLLFIYSPSFFPWCRGGGGVRMGREGSGIGYVLTTACSASECRTGYPRTPRPGGQRRPRGVAGGWERAASPPGGRNWCELPAAHPPSAPASRAARAGALPARRVRSPWATANAACRTRGQPPPASAPRGGRGRRWRPWRRRPPSWRGPSCP